jgi:hypothetical protein
VSAEGTEKEKRNRVEEIFAGACSRYF